jgi:DNA-binding response OmpR family regulator
MIKTILVVDDKKNIRDSLRDLLEAEGYRVVAAEDGQMALYVARDEKPDLVLLDIMMPGMDGKEFLRVFRRDHDTPVIFLTAKVDETDLIIGLEIGADDYITKPFRPREIIARIKTVLRRTQKQAKSAEIVRAADILIDKTRRLVQVAERQIDLTPSEFDLLAVLMSSPGRAFTRAELLGKLQGAHFEGVERTIDVHIRNLRAKVEPDPRHPRYVETVFGVGYRFHIDFATSV